MLHKNNQWYLVQCKPRESFRAEQHLINQHYECFHPTHLVKRKVAGAFRYVIEPLFPHYLFVCLTPLCNVAPIRSTRGVSRLVHFNGIPATLNDIVIEQLKLQCNKLLRKVDEPYFQVNDPVMVTNGCFKDLEAIVTATSGDDRVTLLLNLFNRPQHIELYCSDVVGL